MLTSVNVKTTLLVVALSALFAATAATSASGATDPRKCDSTGGHIAQGQVDGPTFCAYQAAQLAFRRHMTAATHTSTIYSAPMRCSTQGASNLVWTCTFDGGVGTVRFRALSNGWHTRVSVACTNPAATAASFCRP